MKRLTLSQQERMLRSHMTAIHQIRPYYGYPRMTVALRKEGLVVNHKRVYRLMKEMNIRSVIRKKRRFFHRTASVMYPNRLNRKFQASQPNQIFVTDITFLPLNGRFCYLSVIQDLYNNEIVAWQFSNRNDLALVMDTLAQLQYKNVHGSLIHSDQGFQYTSKEYSIRLKQLGIKGSHSHKGNCLDNACIESFFSHLKSELLYFSDCKSRDQLFQVIHNYIHFYNYERFQKKLNNRAPVEYRNAIVA